MRKVAYTAAHEHIRKVMLYECTDGVYVFSYDSVEDTPSISDLLYQTLADAEDYCRHEYKVDKASWIEIADPLANCQHDFILPTRAKGKERNNPLWGQYEILEKGKWIDKYPDYGEINFGGMTVMERLFVSGLIQEFDKAKKTDKIKARKILAALQVDEPSIYKIV